MREFMLQITESKRLVEVWQAGKGPDVLFLPSELGLDSWPPFLDVLAETCRVTVIHYPGFARSEGVQGLDTILDAVLHQLDVVSALRLKRPHVIGHSFGGMLAAEMAAISPADVGDLVLIAPLGLWLPAKPVAEVFSMGTTELALKYFNGKTNPLAQVLKSLSPAPDGETIDRFAALNRGLASAGRLIWPIPDRGLSKRLGRIESRTLIVWGDQDKIIAPDYAREFSRGIPNSRARLYKDSGHMMPFEKGRPLATAIARFFTESGPVTRKARATIIETHDRDERRQKQIEQLKAIRRAAGQSTTTPPPIEIESNPAPTKKQSTKATSTRKQASKSKSSRPVVSKTSSKAAPKPTAKKSPVTKPVTKKSATKVPSLKSASNKSVAKKAAAGKPAPKKQAAKKLPVKKLVAQKSPGKKSKGKKK